MFLNFGYAETSRGQPDWIRKAEPRYRYHFDLLRRVLAGVDLSGKTVLEVGSGRGGNCSYLSRYTKAKRIFGIDLCRGNVKFCRQVHKLSNVVFLRGDAQRLPFREGQFDLVLNVESSHCYADLEKFLAEAYCVLKPGGVFCYADLWFSDASNGVWSRRKVALDTSRFVLLLEEDISGQVSQALKSNNGLPARIRAIAKPGSKRFANRIAQSLEAVSFYLDSGRCVYKLWRFQKPRSPRRSVGRPRNWPSSSGARRDQRRKAP